MSIIGRATFFKYLAYTALHNLTILWVFEEMNFLYTLNFAPEVAKSAGSCGITDSTEPSEVVNTPSCGCGVAWYHFSLPRAF